MAPVRYVTLARSGTHKSAMKGTALIVTAIPALPSQVVAGARKHARCCEEARSAAWWRFACRPLHAVAHPDVTQFCRPPKHFRASSQPAAAPSVLKITSAAAVVRPGMTSCSSSIPIERTNPAATVRRKGQPKNQSTAEGRAKRATLPTTLTGLSCCSVQGASATWFGAEVGRRVTPRMSASAATRAARCRCLLTRRVLHAQLSERGRNTRAACGRRRRATARQWLALVGFSASEHWHMGRELCLAVEAGAEGKAEPRLRRGRYRQARRQIRRRSEEPRSEQRPLAWASVLTPEA